jgi:pimeloyl-ACP methyl ester carboxylesterase
MKKSILFVLCSLFASSGLAEPAQWLTPLTEMYESELGNAVPCDDNSDERFTLCSDALRNEGNSPFVLHHGAPTETTIVLFHGLSDSPFFFRSIAAKLHESGATVIVGLLPGHGKKDADDDMEDSKLAKRWSAHVDEVIAYAHTLSPKVVVGGFSTGGALVTLHILKHPDTIDGLMLFSGALALDESVEDMADIWGIETLAKILDWSYETSGPNPYKYPSVAKYAAFKLLDVIFAVRAELDKGNVPNLPIFVAHSEADVTTPIRGVKQLQSVNKGPNSSFFIEQSYDVCHADVPVSAQQLIEMQFDASQVTDPETCSIPHANPVHQQMLQAMMDFYASLNEGKTS